MIDMFDEHGKGMIQTKILKRTRKLKELNTKHTTAQTEKFRPVAGGIHDKEPKRTGRLILRKMDFFLLRPRSQTKIGAMKPTENAHTRGG